MRLSSVECQAFDFFRLETIKQLPGGSSDLLWERLALCMSANEPAVANAVVALASLHRSFTRGGSGVADSTQYQLALQYCNKAMSSMRGIIAVPSAMSHAYGDIEILLILTLLLFSFEVLHGHWDRAALHLRSGLRVVYNNIRYQPDQLQHQGLREDSARHVVLLRITPCSNIDIMLRAFVRLDGDSISGSEDGYLYPVCDKLPPENFFSLEEANIHLDTLSSSVTEIIDDLDLLARGDGFGPEDSDGTDARMSAYFCAFDRPTVNLDKQPSLASRLETARHEIRKWLAAFTNIPVTDENATEHRLTRVFGFYTWLSVETCQNEDYTTFKYFEEQVCYIVGVMEEYVNAYHDGNLLLGSNYNCNEYTTPNSTMTPSTTSKNSVNNVYIEQLSTEDPHMERRVLRKIDFRLLPILGALYTIALIDRTNISVARISGLDDDLDLEVGNRASVVLLIFFIGYILFELPSNMLIRKIGPAIWLSCIAFAWGALSLGIGFVNTWEALAIMRAFLGVLEAGYYPGCIYLIASWYKRYELQKRISAFFTAATAISGFANIFALGLVQISRVSSYSGWRWIFIIEGAITMLAAIAAYFVVVDFPGSKSNRFLTEEERAFVQARLIQDRGNEDEHAKINAAVILRTMMDWKIWSFSMMYFAGASGVYAFAFFLPLILRQGLGYSLELSFVLSAFPPCFAVIVVMTVSWLADKYRVRGLPVMCQGLFGIIGLCMTGFLNSPVPRYIGTFLGYAGAIGLVVTSMSWMANNLRGDGKRAIATAVMISVSGVGGIYSSLVFRQQDAPDYIPGLVAVMVANAIAVLLAISSMLVLRIQNKRADEGVIVIEGLEGFRYTI
ncbi:hypothetical protein Q7P35_005733 [Cladosporium inversicolor]